VAHIFSTRLDESLIERLDRAARALGIPKKRLVEEALRAHLDEIGENPGEDVFDHTCGAWGRREGPETTVRKAREAFRRSLAREKRMRR